MLAKRKNRNTYAPYGIWKRALALPLILTLLLSLLLAAPASAADSGGFRDISNEQWWYRWVRSAYEQGLMDGIGDNRFDPTGLMTRGMYVTVLGRIAGIDPSAYTSDLFTDVSYGDWYGGYVNWAADVGVTNGVDDGIFAPNQNVTRQEMAVLVSRYLAYAAGADPDDENTEDAADEPASEPIPPDLEEPTGSAAEPEEEPSAAPPEDTEPPEEAADNTPEPEPLSRYITDAADVAEWAVDGVRDLARLGLMTGDDDHLYRPKAVAIRAEAAALFVRLGKHLNGGTDLPAIKTWVDWVDPATIYEVPAFSDPILSGEDIILSAKDAGIPGNSSAFQALISINAAYSGHFSRSDRAGTLLFLFEGCGASTVPEERRGAMAVVVRNGKIIHINRNCSTLPDWPFSPSRNAGRAMPTIMSGIYDFTTCNHMTKSYCAALHVVNDRVLRFYSQNSWYASTSGQINIHRRYSNSFMEKDSNSQGCLLIGAAGTGPYDEYARYASALGIINSGEPGTRYYQYRVSGKVIIDRSFGRDYLRAVGYSDAAIDALG